MARWTDKEAAIRSLERKGKVYPDDLVKAARNPSHPCHSDFTWDVKTAALKCWRREAQELIRRVSFEVQIGDASQPVCEYVSSPDETLSSYSNYARMKGVTKVSTVLEAEVVALYRLASRVYGIAVAKQDIVGAETVASLLMVRETLGELKGD